MGTDYPPHHRCYAVSPAGAPHAAVRLSPRLQGDPAVIQVENLTRRYGSVQAIQDVSFEVRKGEVVGFLGPNGAGKTTTMRIVTGCIGATSGRALVGGHDVLEHPRLVKQKIGYLPENPPLYGTMPVRDYVAFAARIKGVDKAEDAADRAIDLVGLKDVRHRVIDHLSKGYRQRVGLAQALVHEPEVLILDEPTSGLDPAQRVEIRELLARLAEGERTVILSTHVLPEVEAICDRVIIITRGRVVAEGAIDDLAATDRRARLRLARPSEDAIAALKRVSGVTGVEDAGHGLYRVSTTSDVREALAAAAVPFGLLELGGDARLEDIYLRYTTGSAA